MYMQEKIIRTKTACEHGHTICSQLLHSVNLLVFTLLLVHLILHMSPHHSPHLRSHHLSIPQSFTPDLKLISFTNPFPHSIRLHRSRTRTVLTGHWCLY